MSDKVRPVLDLQSYWSALVLLHGTTHCGDKLADNNTALPLATLLVRPCLERDKEPGYCNGPAQVNHSSEWYRNLWNRTPFSIFWRFLQSVLSKQTLIQPGPDSSGQWWNINHREWTVQSGLLTQIYLADSISILRLLIVQR
ncbi:hypothetical protein RRG08_064132 [Elysia crispata]|uniref:Uncharacterized protein n=1 Tax=Elysia crispata TaxID=231223 RepID=A0AAE0ZLW8_9GAST|nr:hypothetical protein RRG08_064132 [Elysia crispata]